jgi:hypothetical protein
MKNKFYTLAVTMLLSAGASAQSWFGGSYSNSYAVGDFKDYMSRPSWTGFSFEYKSHIMENLAVGVNMGFNFFNEYRDKASYTYETITATGMQRRHTSAIPMMATCAYEGPAGDKLRWFAGLGVGTTYLYRYTNFGSFTFSRETWQFLLAPEVGILYPVNQENILYLTTRYNMNFKNDKMAAQQFISVNIGWALSWDNE